MTDKTLKLKGKETAHVTCDCGGNNDDGNITPPPVNPPIKEPVIMAYFPSWFVYNEKEPTAFPGFFFSTADPDAYERNSNTDALEKILPNINSVVYSFLEIKQPFFKCSEQIRVFNNCRESVGDSYGQSYCADFAKSVPCNAWDHLLTYDSNAKEAGNAMFLDGWSDFRQGNVVKDFVNSSKQDGFDFFPEAIYSQYLGQLLDFDVNTPWNFFHYGNFEAFKDYSKTPFTKIMAIGGYGDPDNSGIDKYLPGWKAAAGDPIKFAKSVIRIAKEFDLDGVDLDWEPLSAIYDKKVYNTDPLDVINLASILKMEAKDAGLTNFQVNFPITVDQNQIKNFDKSTCNENFVNGGVWAELIQYLDHVNIMGYDMHGGFDLGKFGTGLHSALYPVSGDKSGFSIDGAVEMLHSLGVPYEKMVLGVPGYGRGVSGVVGDGLNQNFTGGAWGMTDKGAGTTSYKSILKLINDKNLTVQHPKAANGKVNGAYINFKDGDNNIFISFDDIESIKEKINYAQEHNMAGMMMWDLSNDKSGAESLLKAIHDSYYDNLHNVYSPNLNNCTQQHSVDIFNHNAVGPWM